ncbi:hypothetical protein, partial [Hyalangium sp.]|uniref:hypothetical protein n=1 Tax=Hyalangium sp. TaxID=2028555 RepID=UPI002D3845F8
PPLDRSKFQQAPIPAPAPDRARLAMNATHTENGMLQPSAQVEAAILGAVNSVGTDYGYMKAMGHQESKFDPAAKAGTSSATGLYQFLDQTWLETVKKHGAEHGMGDLAAQIYRDNDTGKYMVADPTLRQQILDQRYDPTASALMAAEFAQDNQNHLRRTLGIEAGPTELYMAHFLGAGGATKFLGAQGNGKGDQIAANFFPSQAEANRNIFYVKETGQARTLDEVYALLNEKIAPRAEAYELARGE